MSSHFVWLALLVLCGISAGAVSEAIHCPYFDSSELCYGVNKTNFALKYYQTCEVSICGGQRVNASTVGHCDGDTFLRLFNSDGNEIAVNDNVNERSLCSEISFSLPQEHECGEYSFHLGCSGNGERCAGQLDISLSGIIAVI